MAVQPRTTRNRLRRRRQDVCQQQRRGGGMIYAGRFVGLRIGFDGTTSGGGGYTYAQHAGMASVGRATLTIPVHGFVIRVARVIHGKLFIRSPSRNTKTRILAYNARNVVRNTIENGPYLRRYLLRRFRRVRLRALSFLNFYTTLPNTLKHTLSFLSNIVSCSL